MFNFKVKLFIKKIILFNNDKANVPKLLLKLFI
jgi:hypothetical protein